MQLKANLHFHSNEDKKDSWIDYNFFKAIDTAAEKNFNLLAITHHDSFAYTKKLAEYSAKKNILLISGIEITISKAHVVILNCTKDVEKLNTFDDLEKYRYQHPEIFVIAPHPYYPSSFSLGANFDKYHCLFDAVEQSWFYNHITNKNKIAYKRAKKYNLPVIATSDTHNLKYLENSYAIIEAQEKTPEAIFQAIQEQNFQNISHPAQFIRDMVYEVGIKGILLHPVQFFTGN